MVNKNEYNFILKFVWNLKEKKKLESILSFKFVKLNSTNNNTSPKKKKKSQKANNK